MDTTGYKENLLQNCRHIAKNRGGRVVVRGEGVSRKVSLFGKDGKMCVCWYPTEPRINDCEIADLKDACEYVFGVMPFKETGS